MGLTERAEGAHNGWPFASATRDQVLENHAPEDIHQAGVLVDTHVSIYAPLHVSFFPSSSFCLSLPYAGQSRAQEVKLGATIHLPVHEFELGDLAFGLSVRRISTPKI
ncbi:hypothetical protein [Bradyrhizobium sp.]|uniref:hypothetical protein n=1 Tax=Bradyrhizobium sp. TaxID=376 RepID=UPI003C66EA16